MRSFDIPEFYRSPIISRVKAKRKAQDARKQDFSPTVLDFGTVVIQLARHFGFCFGVENAIEISYKAIDENPGRNVFLLSQMIHNPEVNADLESRGVRFLQDTLGNALHPMDDLGPEDVVIVPAFGTTVEMAERLEKQGVDVQSYNTTCPFVEKVWKRSAQLGKSEHTVIIHGKPQHRKPARRFRTRHPRAMPWSSRTAQRRSGWRTGWSRKRGLRMRFGPNLRAGRPKGSTH